jgi:hypothetical protein
MQDELLGPICERSTYHMPPHEIMQLRQLSLHMRLTHHLPNDSGRRRNQAPEHRDAHADQHNRAKALGFVPRVHVMNDWCELRNRPIHASHVLVDDRLLLHAVLDDPGVLALLDGAGPDGEPYAGDDVPHGVDRRLCWDWVSKIVNILQIFGGLVLSCIKTNFCKKIFG